MRKIECLTDYFVRIIEFNRQGSEEIRTYCHEELLNIGWSNEEISEAKINSFVAWLTKFIEHNKEMYNKSGLKIPSKWFFRMGWSKPELEEGIQRVTKKSKKSYKWILIVAAIIIIFWALVSNETIHVSKVWSLINATP